MNDRHRSKQAGFTFIELLTVLVFLGILVLLAVPRFTRELDRIRARGALDHMAAEIYRVRMNAVANGRPTSLVLESDAGGCVRTFRIISGEEVSHSIEPGAGLPGLCLRHTGDSILTFDGRGMLRPPARSIRASYGMVTDTLILSIAGRVRRSY